jgi:hypothetical protein
VGKQACPSCGRSINVKSDGTFHKHLDYDGTRCPGSDEFSGEPLMVEIPLEDLEYSDESPDGRVSVPLRMLKGNIEVLLENRILCQAVSFMRDPEHRNAVILVFHGTDKEHAAQVGFKTMPMRAVQ